MEVQIQHIHGPIDHLVDTHRGDGVHQEGKREENPGGAIHNEGTTVTPTVDYTGKSPNLPDNDMVTTCIDKEKNLKQQTLDGDKQTTITIQKGQQALKGSSLVPSTASTIPVHCADGNAGKVKRERRQAEPWSVRLGQSDSSGYGPEICELEERSNILQLKKKEVCNHCMRNC